MDFVNNVLEINAVEFLAIFVTISSISLISYLLGYDKGLKNMSDGILENTKRYGSHEFVKMFADFMGWVVKNPTKKICISDDCDREGIIPDRGFYLCAHHAITKN